MDANLDSKLTRKDLAHLQTVVSAAYACLGRPGCSGCPYTNVRKDCRERLLDDLYEAERRINRALAGGEQFYGAG